MIEVVPNRSELDDTFEQWETNANQALREITAQGVKVTKVMVVVDELVAWCREKGRAPNSASRAEFVSHVLGARDKSTEADQS